MFKESDILNLDSPDASLVHREIILAKPFLKKLHEEWYSHYIKRITVEEDTKHLEIGSGGGFLKTIMPSIITSDIMDIEEVDMCFMAEKMPFEDATLDSIFMVNVLHHIPDCEQFFNEVQRVLKPKGKLVLVEPANTIFSRLVYKNVHHELFDENADWKFSSMGPMTDANGALPWIIFNRDLHIFQSKFESLKLRSITLHTPFRYLLTGGLSYKSLVPGWSFGVVSFLERILSPLFPAIAMFQTIEVNKIDD
ncbi:MAG: class I SAM-dependent methyltransferase [Flavobacteriales bacterium]|nr:class I SAM-dependent methyltransferase [Flavobacteriales bacterium]